jgi:hypothetical protein
VTIGDKAPFVIPTTFASPQELSGLLPRDWREFELRISYINETRSGTKHATRIVKRVRPDAELFYVEPTTFYDASNSRYLLHPEDDKAGEPAKDAFTNNPQGFQLVITDPTRPNIRDQNVANVALFTERSGQGVVDRIETIEMDPIVKDGRQTDHYDLGKRQMVVVTDRVDDGAEDALSVDGTRSFRFSPDDGNKKDSTILRGD